MAKEKVNKETGEIITDTPEILGEVKIIQYGKTSDGTPQVGQDFANVPSMAEQHSAHLTDINYLMEKFKPDELAQYIAARSTMRPEIVGHDFSREPDMTGAMNQVYQLKSNFDALSDDVKMHFKNHVEFLKFIDNPQNQEKMLKLGLMTKREIANNTTDSVATSGLESGTQLAQVTPEQKPQA